ncbi:hypothetical protein QYE76_023230 [Lolium multiflorum]|uniref:Retrotransposon gag domain-containing protein n=1 Tax=Lolium multiflorum TaxID=4521 RepID=A0AAD8REA4_LOLMU|nr:hypothetical protein QYE76_023230 [Lolium multiflorum]
MSITLGAATKLLDDMMINYSEWHTERAPQGKKVNSVEETSSLSDKIDVIMSMLVNGRSNVDPNNVPLASLVAQEENVDVNFIKNNNFNNNAYRNNSGNNYRPYPSANGNGYGNSYGNSYNNNRNVPSGLEAMLKEFISTQTAFNKSVEEKLDKIDTIASRVDRLASDVNLLKLKVMPNNDIDNKITTTANAIQVRINENIRLMAELRARWDREENEKLAKENNVAKVWTITTTSNANSSHVAAPPTINGNIIGVGNVSTPSAKRTKLPEIAKTAETACDKTAEIFSNLGNNDPIAVAHNDLDFDDCHISEVIKFLQKLAKSPNASAINLAFTKHITNALIKAREEKLKLETSIPRKLEDGWEPIIKMKFNDFECNALCDLGASISVMPKKIYDMLDLPPLKNCYLDVNLADNVKKKPLGRIDNVHITVNNNLVPVDFVVLDIECNASCPIVLGRPFLRTVGAVIDMREGSALAPESWCCAASHFATINLQRASWLLLVRLNLGFILRETCFYTHHTFHLGFPTDVCIYAYQKPIESEEQIKVEPAVAIVKDLVTENVEDGHIIFCEDASNIVSHPNKSMKASVPVLSVRIGDHCYYGLCDIGASISAIPYELYTEIMHEIGSCELEDIDVVIRLANRETISPIGIVRDVEVLCGKIKYPADFLVLGSAASKFCPIIFGRPFLNTCGAIIDCKKEKIVTKFAGESYEFNFSKFAKTPYKADLPNEDFRVEQCASIALAPSNPLQQHLENSESEVFREERDELDEIFLRQPILKHDLPVEDLGVTPPPKEDPVFDLKPLPDNLKYAYIDEKKTYPVIISAKLSDIEEERLLEILKKHRGAIGYTLDDLKGISPAICQHAINIEDGAKPVVEHQRRLIPKMKDVSYSRLCGAENTREKRALRRAGIRRGNSLPEGEIDAIAIVIELDIISIIIIISTIYTAITTAAPRHRCISMDEVRKKLFVMSLSGKAAHWYKLLKDGRSLDWKDIVPLFYSKFYPASEIHKDRNRIYNFWPHDGESIAQAWGRLKSLMLKCPIHELPGNVIIDNFYARLSFQDKTLLDTSCSGSFTRNKEEFKRDLLDRIQENTEGWENDKDRESGIIYDYKCIEAFMDTDKFRNMSATYGLDSQVAANLYKAFASHYELPKKNFDKYHEPYKDKIDSSINKCVVVETVDHVIPEAYIEKTPFPAKMKEYSVISSAVNKSEKKPIEPEEQIKVEPAVAIVKDLVTENVEDGHIIFCEDASNIVSHPNKPKQVSVPMLSVRIGDHCYYGLCDIGASVSAIPYELYTEIMHEIDSCELEDIDVVIQLANRETISPIGIVRDVEVLCGKIKYPADFLVLGSAASDYCPIIFGRPFLNTCGAIIDCKKEKILTKFAGESYEFNFSKFTKTPYKADLPSDDFKMEQCASIVLVPNNPLQQHLENSESEVFRKERDELEEIFLRQPILKHDLPVEDLGTTPPPKEDPVFDLKPLPDNLKYAHIDDKKIYHVIISSKLSEIEEERLLEILKKHRGAIGYTLDDLKGISPSICQHAINMEDDAKPVVEHQRRLIPKMKEVVRNEVLKLLEAGIIYPIADSRWVSPVHCVPKKGGMTVVPNDNDELIPQRVVVGLENITYDPVPVNDSFPNEQLAVIKVSSRESPWYADYANFIVSKEVEILQEENQRLRRMLEYYSIPITRPPPPHSDNNESLRVLVQNCQTEKLKLKEILKREKNPPSSPPKE